MKTRRIIVTLSIALAYVLLIGLVAFNVFKLSDLYNREELEMVMSVEEIIETAVQSDSDELIIQKLEEARDEYLFEVVVVKENDVIYNTVPYEIGDSLLGKSHPEAMAREAQGPFETDENDYFIWYSIYRLNDSVFVQSFLKTMLYIVFSITLLLILTVTIIFKGLFDPLIKIKRSIKKAKKYDFNDDSVIDDDVNKEFHEFTQVLEEDIENVSRQHTKLEKQLQANRQYLKNVLVVSRSMVHDFKTPLHRALIESDLAIKDHPNNDELIEYSETIKGIINDVMKDINRTLSMLAKDETSFDLELIDIDIVETMMRTSALFNKSMLEKDLYLDFEAPQSLMVRTEESTLILLINNLMTNMVIYAKEDSDLKVDVDLIGNRIVMMFSNEAYDVDIERMKNSQHLFNAMKQDDDHKHSSGNGLYLIKELTHLLKGDYELLIEDSIVTVKVSFDYEQ